MRRQTLAERAQRMPIAVALAAALVLPIAAWSADVFDFVPAGGRTLLSKVLAGRPADAELDALLGGKQTRDGWLAYLRSHGKALAGVAALNEKQLLTMADYLAFNMPRTGLKPPSPPTQANWDKLLPPDGRDFALNYCQGCHIITVVVTQNRTKEAWLGTMGKPSHVQIKLRPEQREALANYLVINGAIPIDDVPEELRAGGATY